MALFTTGTHRFKTNSVSLGLLAFVCGAAGLMVIVIITVGSVPLWFPTLYQAIQLNDSIEPSDALLIHGWVAQDQLVKMTAKLYRTGFGKIVFTTGGRFERLKDLVGVDNWSDATKTQLVKLGVPAQHIIPIYQRFEGSYGEAVAAREKFLEYGIDSVIMISEPFHLWRSCRTYKKMTHDIPVQYYCITFEPEGMKTGAWWKTHEGMKSLAQEYLSIAYYFWKGYL